ncbi:MAG: glycoside hydrolase [Mucilaginibacter sp.]|uniref:hypothetical protein n=1 Tax=Mucilaginibacter sp. TaxID=1882438 RepID=UPI0026381256|nr:hypothetical protein [Mucilaginibacter sp.]MDB5003098.1 glycoside hydrolase [Mucilaginibacter sp.]
MKRKFLATIVLLCSVLICFAAIAELSGKWKGVLKMSDGNELPLTYVFKVDGEKLSGSVISERGEIPLTEGKVKGSDFTFNITINDNVIPNTGKYYGDSTVINSDFNGRKMHLKLIRSDK